MCVSNGLKTCSTVAYVYYYAGSDSIFYITLRNGVESVEKVMEDMFTKNTTNSTIKSGVDAWYKHYLLENYDEYIEDTIFCNDRSIYSLNGWNPNGGKTNAYLLFNEYNNAKRDLSCTNETDKFSISNNNAKLTYKVGLITSPEINLLYNNNLQWSGQNYWLSSPYNFNSKESSERFMYNDGTLFNIVSGAYGLRFAISLIPGTEFASGDGSTANPYVVDVGVNP
jgi:hypothetical protein